MAKYIDADRLIRRLENRTYKAVPNFIKMINEQEAADVVEVRHGHWIYEGNKGRFPACRCSECGNFENADWAVLGYNANYCTNCGASMVNEDE